MIFIAPFNAAYVAIMTALNVVTNMWGSDAVTVKLMKNNPAIDSNTELGSFTEADFSGYEEKVVQGAATVLIDPLTGKRVIHTLVPEVNAWRWFADDVTNLPQTIYGAYATDGGTVLLGAVKFDTPIILTDVLQYIDLGEVRFVGDPYPLGS